MYRRKSKHKLAAKVAAGALALVIVTGTLLPAGVMAASTASASGSIETSTSEATAAADAVNVVNSEASVVESVNVEAADEEAEETLTELNENNGVVLFAEQELASPAAATDSVTLQYNRIIRHEKWFTRSFTVQYDGKTKVAYCIEPKDYPPDKGTYTSTKYDSEIMTKALYYAYGYPGYETVTKNYIAKGGLVSDYSGNDGAYVISHLVLSYFYDNESASSDAFKGLSTGTKTFIKNMASELKNNWPDVPEDAYLAFDMPHVKAEWNKDKQWQETPVIQLQGHKDNKITVTVPEGTTMVKLSDNELTEYTAPAEVDIRGGDEFFFTAPADMEGSYESGEMIGSLQDFQPYLIKVAGKQDILYCGDGGRDAVSFSIEWEDMGTFILNKVSAEPEITENNDAYSLEGAAYTLEDADGQTYAELTTDADGNAEVLLPYGDYTLQEQTAPEGYLVDAAFYEIVIEQDETAFTHEEQLQPQPVLTDDTPQTGDEFQDKLLIGMIIASLAIMTMIVAVISPVANGRRG